MGLNFSNPIGLAAGFDKDGDAIGGTLDLGFSFVEVGSVTPKPQPGNPYPRMFRLKDDKAVINRYGFNSRGMDYVANNLTAFLNDRSGYRQGLVGINAGKNKETSEEEAHSDFTSVIERSAFICPSPSHQHAG
jgi:dihydroorotate dehydrogenase